jgi:RNAse (barnase) inhibitor barstar
MAEQQYTRSWSIDFKGLRSKDSMLKKVATELAFPAHFGRNLDALYDCLTDLPLQKGHKYAIHLDELERGPAGDAIHAAFADAREAWADEGVTLAIIRE